MKTMDISLAAPAEYASRTSPKANKEPQTHKYRSKFMRDRDRILFSQAFRKAIGKTQLLPVNYGDATRTRLTHTLEVAQFSRTIGKFLQLDVDLVEAIALGHDVGHTPFGHAGERALNLIMNGCETLELVKFPVFKEGERGFKHNLQSVRVLAELEQSFKHHPGLELTNFTLWGIQNHTSLQWKNDCIYKEVQSAGNAGCARCLRSLAPVQCTKDKLEVDFYKRYEKYVKLCNGNKQSWSFEAFVVKQCDEIAQRNHDLEDALDAGLLTDGQIVKEIKGYLGTWICSEVDKNSYNKLENACGKKDFRKNLSSFMVPFYIQQLLSNSLDNLQRFAKQTGITGKEQWVQLYPELTMEEVENLIAFPTDLAIADNSFQKKFLRNAVMNSYRVQRMDGRGDLIIKKLFKAYLNNPEQLPDEVIYQLYKTQYFSLIDGLWNKYSAEGNMDDDKIVAIIVGQLRNNLVFDRNKAEFQVHLLRTICDYISGMTDAHAIKDYQELYG